MEGNALYIGPRSGDNEATPPIQRMTRGDTIGKCNRPNSVSETTHTTQKVTRGFFLEDELNSESQPMTLLHVAHGNPCKWVLNYINVLDDPLNEGATDRMARNLSISDSFIGIVHVQECRLNQEPPKEIEKCCLNEKIIYNCLLDDNMVV